MPAQRTGGGDSTPSWRAFYYLAREEMAFRYGLRRIPKDRYKEAFALGLGSSAGAAWIYRQLQARGEAP